jgi:AraC-like DNA-binding protein
VISWGKQNGKRRFKCKNCGIYFTSENKSVSLKNKEIWFRKWIVGKQTYEQISAESGYSVSTLQRYFSVMLSKAPKLNYSQNKEVYLLIDGTYFSNEICLVVYRDNVLSKPNFTELQTESIMKN